MAVEDDFRKQLLRDKCARLFLSAHGSNMSRLVKECDVTYSHTEVRVKSWIRQGLLVGKKSGRTMTLEYTERGARVGRYLRELVDA